MIPFEWITSAQRRIAPHIIKTPLTYDPNLEIYLKWENHQVTGSFKARGALNKTLTLEKWEQQQGLVTASAGNHGQGVAMAGKIVGAPVSVFVGENAVPAKIDAIRALGASIHVVPGGFGEAEQAGLTYASRHSMTWISPYNDGHVIAGQGTIALEILDELPGDSGYTWVVPASGGGLIAGIGAVIKNPDQGSQVLRLIGVQSEASAFMYHLFYDGTQEGVKEYPSIADGLAGPVEKNSLTIPLVRKYVDDIFLVTEHEIGEAIAYAWENYQERIEGSAAASLALILTGRIQYRPAIVILTGGNIQPKLHENILNGNWFIDSQGNL